MNTGKSLRPSIRDTAFKSVSTFVWHSKAKETIEKAVAQPIYFHNTQLGFMILVRGEVRK